MIKTLVIFLLLAALCIGGALSRPSEADFHAYFKAKADAQSKNAVDTFMKNLSADDYLKHCTYQDHIVWADIMKDGKIVYTGAFSRWFEHAQ